MGKDLLQRFLRLYVGGYDLSGDSRTFNEAQLAFDPVDQSGWDEAVRNYMQGFLATGLTGYQALMNDTAGRSYPVLTTTGSNRLSLCFGAGHAPAVGDPVYLLGSMQMSDNASFNAGIGVLTADFLPDAGQSPDHFPLGVVLLPNTALAATGNGTTVDQLAGSTRGAHANLHILASSGGAWAYTIEHSTDGISWATLITFTSDGSAITSEHQAVTGTVNQYIREVHTRTSGTCTAVVTFARN